MKTKIALMTVVATVALAGAAFSAKAQFGYRHAFVPVPRVRLVGPRVFIPAPHVWIPPVPVPAVSVGYGYYGAPVYRDRAYARVEPVYVRRGYGHRRW